MANDLVLRVSLPDRLTAISGSGGTITEVGEYRVHTFTNGGTFSVNDSIDVEIFMVANGGNAYKSGGGGGGGEVVTGNVSLSKGNHNVVIGLNSNDGRTTFAGITAYKGGDGGEGQAPQTTFNSTGKNGDSGGDGTGGSGGGSTVFCSAATNPNGGTSTSQNGIKDGLFRFGNAGGKGN